MATIQDFEELKSQLVELAKVVNTFNSEAVQLKIVEIVLSEHMTNAPHASHVPHIEVSKDESGKKKPSSKAKTSKIVNGEPKKSKSKSLGPTTILSTLIDEGFFSKRQAINNIIDYVKNQKATTLKANEISTPLGRLVRDGRLKREKNSDGQYEYFT